MEKNCPSRAELSTRRLLKASYGVKNERNCFGSESNCTQLKLQLYEKHGKCIGIDRPIIFLQVS